MQQAWLAPQLKKLAAISVISLFSLSSHATAQQPKIEQTPYQDWLLVCAEQQDKKQCQMMQTLSVEQGEQSQRVLQAIVTRNGEQRLLEISVPLGVDLRPGLLIQIDEGEVGSTPYLTCNANGCAAVIALDNKVWRTLRDGNNLKVGVRGLGQPENTVLQLSLKGFTAAGNALMQQ